MSSVEPDRIDQALFGYADGHRQIASSIRLPNRDLFLLSSASDLATGTILRPGESYLTGLPLAESKRYALIRTWPALEMPRPGCVWSHVLVIDFRLLSVRSDLSQFLDLFHKPQLTDHQSYSKSVVAEKAPTSSHGAASPLIVREILQSYYNMDVALLGGDNPSDELEASVLAVWSQQWPKLRIGFTFRTAVATERKRSEGVGYDVRVASDILAISPKGSIDERWLDAAVTDALAPGPTPLRRFFWRYGRDVLNPRRNFCQLANIFLEAQASNTLAPEVAREIFDAFPTANDAIVLKRDALGLNPTESAIFPSLSLPDFIKYIVEMPEFSLSDEDIADRFRKALPSDIVPISRTLKPNSGISSFWFGALLERFAEVATHDVILDDDLPGWVRSAILKSRPDLVDSEGFDRLSDKAISDLVFIHGDDELTRRIASNIVGRNFDHGAEKLVLAAPVAISSAAISRAARGTLDRSWTKAITHNYARLPLRTIVGSLTTTSELAAALSIFGLSSRGPFSAAFWRSLLERVEDDVRGDDRINLFAFLLVSALVGPETPDWPLVFRSFPILRAPMLHAQLPRTAYSYLDNGLPHFRSAQYWDLNKRFILTIAKLNQRRPILQDMRELNFSNDDFYVFNHGLEEEEERSHNRFWWF